MALISIVGVFLGESKEVFEFISRLIAQAKRRGESIVNIILYCIRIEQFCLRVKSK